MNQQVHLHSNSLISSMLQLPASERAARLEALVLEHVVSVSGQLETDSDEPLMEAGLDSLATIELVSQLSQSLGDGVVLSATVLFDHPTVLQLAAHIGSLLCWEEPAEARTMWLATVPQGDVSVQESLTIAGTSCVLPGASNSSANAWCLLSNGVDPICGVPSGRWNERQYAESSEQEIGSKCYVQCGGFVVGLEGFDNTHFRLSASEAKQMDPQQRAVLEVCLLQCVFESQEKSLCVVVVGGLSGCASCLAVEEQTSGQCHWCVCGACWRRVCCTAKQVRGRAIHGHWRACCDRFEPCFVCAGARGSKHQCGHSVFISHRSTRHSMSLDALWSMRAGTSWHCERSVVSGWVCWCMQGTYAL